MPLWRGKQLGRLLAGVTLTLATSLPLLAQTETAQPDAAPAEVTPAPEPGTPSTQPELRGPIDSTAPPT
ncbi:MAG: hypothetical protein KKF33_11335 [Alphaproteobacteria bacterium]|nr:hypothetical protein [Alphaproteobacteria bacterium]